MNAQESQNENSFQELQKGSEAIRPLNEDEQANIKGGGNPPPPGPPPTAAMYCAKYVHNPNQEAACGQRFQKCISQWKNNLAEFNACMSPY